MAEIIIPYKPYPKQQEIHICRKRWQVIVAGRRAGKTTMAVNEIIKRAVSAVNQQIWYIAPSYRQAKMIAWRMLLKYLPEQAVLKKNESELTAELKNGSVISLKGAENEDSLRGVFLTFCVMDEYSDIKPNVWHEIVRPMLTDKKGDCWFIGTPKGYNHFYDLFALIDENKQSWKLKSSDNPHLPAEEIAQAKRELPPDVFAQEYEGEFKKFTGLVYPEFDRETMTEDLSYIRDNKHHYNFYRSIDFGTHNPTAVLFIAEQDENLYVFDEIYERNISFEDLAELIRAKSGNMRYVTTFRDPSAAQMGIELARLRISTTEANNDVEAGITKLRSYLVNNRIKVGTNCSNTIYEFENYRYIENDETKPDKQKNQVVFKKNDHALDAFRYFVYSRKFEKEERRKISMIRQKFNPLTGRPL